MESEKNYLDEQSSSSKTQVIFSKNFYVQNLKDPQLFLPKFQQNIRYEPTCNQLCLSSCGDCCIACSGPCGLWGCKSCCCTYNLPTSKAGLVEAFGKFKRLLHPGLNLINPCSQQVKVVDLRLKVMPCGRHPTLTKDNVKVDIDASVSYRVINPIISQYVLGLNLNRALVELTVSSLRQTIGEYTLDHVLSKRFEIAEKARKIVSQGIPPGIIVQNVFIDEIVVPVEIEKNLTSAAKQKRLSQATIINSKADVESADLMRQSAQLLDTKAAMQIRYLQMVQKMGQNSKGVLIMMDIGTNKKGFK